jgi:hypothetical protein
MASPDFANRFLPPNPYFSFFFVRFEFAPPAPASLPPRLPPKDGFLLLSSSMATSKRSLSLSVGPVDSVLRSIK